MRDSLSILIICDPSLKNEIELLIGEHRTNLTVIYWSKDSPIQPHPIDPIWDSEKHWDVLFSVYSDYILSPYALSKIRIPLNIHPALPENPGVGHDVYPLIDNQGNCGATIHWMEEKVDHGVIFESRVTPLHKNATYPLTRKLNQTAVLYLFEKWFKMATKGCQSELLEKLQASLGQGRGWTSPTSSTRDRRTRLIAFRKNNPSKWERLQIPLSLLSTNSNRPTDLIHNNHSL